MPDTNLETEYDLRKPYHWAELNKEADGFITAQGREDFTARALAEHCECSMGQARRVLNSLIADGALEYEGTTRDMVYRKAKRKKCTT